MHAVAEILGALAHLKQLAAAWAVRITPLRALSVLSNLLFVAYGLLIAHWPTLVLNALQLPINVQRLFAARRLVRQIDAARDPATALAVLRRAAPREERVPAGTVLFRKGDAADRALVVESGEIELAELGVRVGPGDLLGEVGLLLPERARTATAICRSDVVARAIHHAEFEALCRANPTVGFALMRLVSRRLRANEAALLARGAGGLPA